MTTSTASSALAGQLLSLQTRKNLNRLYAFLLSFVGSCWLLSIVVCLFLGYFCSAFLEFFFLKKIIITQQRKYSTLLRSCMIQNIVSCGTNSEQSFQFRFCLAHISSQALIITPNTLSVSPTSAAVPITLVHLGGITHSYYRLFSATSVAV